MNVVPTPFAVDFIDLLQQYLVINIVFIITFCVLAFCVKKIYDKIKSKD